MDRRSRARLEVPGKKSITRLETGIKGHLLPQKGVGCLREHFESGGEQDTLSLILDGTIDIIVNTPYGVGARLDGYEIRSAAVAKGVPCITTVQGLAAAVQGIEALIRDEVGVRSLQEHAAHLTAARGDAR